MSHQRLTAFLTYVEPELRTADTGELVAVLQPHQASDARRLAASWNACLGMPVSDLMMGPTYAEFRDQMQVRTEMGVMTATAAYHSLSGRHRSALAELKRAEAERYERNRLRTALEHIATSCEIDTLRAAIDYARSALNPTTQPT